ncbi:HdeD family acid-resistance protein [Pseudoroseicyclus sp. CXY001]|uniref:HdeD family acid-resistance protein n=1 Tax=Pseudoroseicyclus sp. CXY001 TaxID=3242492 RepID=UPI003571068B
MRSWLILILIGVIFGLGGIAALANPFAASIAATTIVGLVFLFGGVLQLWMAWSDREDAHRIWHGVVGLMGLVAGVFLLADPLSGLVSLTLFLGILFLITGIARLAVALRLRGSGPFWPLLLSGLASLVIGVLVFADFGTAAGTLLGILLGVELLVEAAAFLTLGLVARRR